MIRLPRGAATPTIVFIIGSVGAGLCYKSSPNSRNLQRTRPTPPANIDLDSIVRR